MTTREHKFRKIEDGEKDREEFSPGLTYYRCCECGLIAFGDTKYISVICGYKTAFKITERGEKRRLAKEISCDDFIIREIIE